MVDSDSDENGSEQATPRASKRKVANTQQPKASFPAGVSVTYRDQLLTSAAYIIVCDFARLAVVDAGDEPSFSLTTGAYVSMIAWGRCD